MLTRTLGGDRLGAGKKQQVHMHGYERSTHDLGYTWRSTMAAGTLVPFLCEVGLPGDTFDINLGCEIMTHPTVGPLFGSYKVQLDTFVAPIRLYHSMLHNNALGIGLKMHTVKLPKLTLFAEYLDPSLVTDIDNSQINPSCLLSYLGIRGVGNNQTPSTTQPRKFNAIPFLAYWEIYKNYYSNKQEEIGAVIHTPSEAIVETVYQVQRFRTGTETEIPYGSGGGGTLILGDQIRIYYDKTTTVPIPSQVIISTDEVGEQSADVLTTGVWNSDETGATYWYIWAPFRQTYWGNLNTNYWKYKDNTTINTGQPAVATFPLSNIDDMRNAILATTPTDEFEVNDYPLAPYNWIYEAGGGIRNMLSNQEGLALKTYQSDLFNNWIQTEWIDGIDGISTITAIDTTSGSFTLDTLNLSKKVYDMLNRIAVSGGSYDDWLDTVYDHERYRRAESPMYQGGLIKELVFQEVVSLAQSSDQPLGTLAGQGRMAQKHKGGNVVIKIEEPSYIIGIISITPRIDYSQGNKWDVHLDTMDDFHKPALDEIGFQELITEQMAWWDSIYTGSTFTQKSAGKQPAWMNYMTNVNQVRGNFAIATNEMFMTLNRRYEMKEDFSGIKDLTTYIDPSKFNFIFAQTSLDAQNFWAQIGIDMTVRRKMSAKIMPNL